MTLPLKYHRKTTRLQGYDYSQAGGYFVTIVTQGRECLFGEIPGKEMKLNSLGQIVEECWQEIPAHFPNTKVDTFVVMPNHVHGIIFIHENNPADADTSDRRGTIYRAPTVNAPTSTIEQFGKPIAGSLPTIIRTFKAAVTRRAGRKLNSANIWQRNYYEHIIRDQADYERISGYISANPSNWVEDDENPANV